MRTRTLAPLMLLAAAAFAAYTYYYSDTLTTISTANWTQNGSVTATGAGLTATGANGGSLISKVAVPGGMSQYEVKITLTLAASGGTYVSYLRASTDAMSGPAAQGTYFSVELQNPTFSGGNCSATLAVKKRSSGSVSVLSSTVVACHSGMTIRSIFNGQFGYLPPILVYVDNTLYLQVLDSSIPSGQPGIGAFATAAGNSIASVNLGPLDTVAPGAMTSQSIGSSIFPTRVDMQWPGVVDDANGIGLLGYQLYVGGGLVELFPEPEFSDPTLLAGQNYNYLFLAVDQHGNGGAPASVFGQTPPAGAIDPRRVGVRPTGAYWGASGEQIDMLSGNLNFTIPIFQAMGRGGWGQTFALSYNSQFWRQDSGGTWKMARDIGYGLGWRLQVGSLTPYYRVNWTLDHYLFTDSTGAEYRLNVNTNGVWTSSEGIYVWYDTTVSPSRLYFPDGSFWVMGCISGGTEQDAGTMYPTLMEDSNGNQITIQYNTGVNAVGVNSSSRPSQVLDVRTNGLFQFTYTTDPVLPHLTTIVDYIGSGGSYTFNIATGQALNSPFNGSSYGTTSLLTSLTRTGTSLTTTFTYDAGGSGELTQMTTPYGGHMRWAYSTFSYAGSRSQREVSTRYLLKAAGATETAYAIQRDSADASRNVHNYAIIDDPGGKGEKAWYFQTNTAGFDAGLLLQLDSRTMPGQVSANKTDLSWVQDPAGRPYIGTALTTLDSTLQKKTTQTLDQYGNVTQTQLYNYGNLSTAARTHTNTYLTGSNYSSRYIFNRLVSSTVSDGTKSAVPVQNQYDGPSRLSDQPNMTRHDSAYGTSMIYRGLVTHSSTLTNSVDFWYDIGGNVTLKTDNGVTTTVGLNSSTYYAAPSSLTVNALTSNINWTTFLALSSQTGPNGDSASISYDPASARPSSTTSPYGAVTNFTYNDTSSPPTHVATTNGHWVRTSLDGLGRTIKTETGDASSTKSVIDTVYDSCGCSPTGKMTQTSQPYAPGGTPVWTTYTYDGLGRTLTTIAPDGSTTQYIYSVNTVKVIDPATHWKTFTTDAFGNVTSVLEPDPNLGNVTATYTYDVLNHLTGVSMPRGSTTQTRTFNYTSRTTVGAYLLSAKNPETNNIAVTYTYNSDGTLASKTDANNQQMQYSYDAYKRLTQMRHYPVIGQPEDTSQQVNYYYDTNPFDTSGTFSQYTSSRLAAVSYSTMVDNHLAQQGPTFQEWYSYTKAGLATKKRLHTSISTGTNLDATYAYDNEGKMTSVAYPASGGTFTNSFDSMSRLVGLTNPNNSSVVSNVSYGPANELLGISYFGQPETRTYNNLLQLTNLVSQGAFLHLNLQYVYPGTTNNGRISSQKDINSGEEVLYTYDSLNRLAMAATSAASDLVTTKWGESYTYDGFGNLLQKTPTKGSPPQLSVNVDANTNRVTGPGYTYDGNGNTLTVYGGAGYYYDGENRVFRALGVVYAYSPRNERVWKGTYDANWNLTAQEVYFYGVDGKKMGTYQSGVTPTDLMVYFGNKPVGHATSPQITVFSPAVRDRLGSSPLGSYYPYGEDKGTPAPNDQVKFATYTRDSATMLDYSMNRYYGSNLGRFMTPDPYRASGGPSNPLSWNRYAYVHGDPVNFADPRGLMATQCITDCGDGGTGDAGGGGVTYYDPSGVGSGEGGYDPGMGKPGSGGSFQGNNGGVTAVKNLAHNSAVDLAFAGIRAAFMNAHNSDCANWFKAALQTSDNRGYGSLDNFVTTVATYSGAGSFVGGNANALANSPLTPGTVIAVNTNGAFFNRLPAAQTLGQATTFKRSSMQ